MVQKPSTREYLSEALQLARAAIPGWAYAAIVQTARGRVGGRRTPKGDMPWFGPEMAKLAFVGSSPGDEEHRLRVPMGGPNAELFEQKYLAPLGLKREDVVLGYLVPKLLRDDRGRVREPTENEIRDSRQWYRGEMERLTPQAVVALGQTARQELGDDAQFVLPHPSALRLYGDRGEVDRKLRRIKDFLSNSVESEKKLDESAKNGQDLRKGQQVATEIPNSDGTAQQKLADGTSENEEPIEGELLVQIAKSEILKRIVYGVVMDPYGQFGPELDAQGDWPTPSAVEKAAHDYLKGSRKIRIQHRKDAPESFVVESWVEPYASREEYLKAMNGEPHQVVRRQFGDDVLHSGSWVMGVELGPAEWEAFERGELNAFSPGGIGARSPLSEYDMPQVTFITPDGVPV